MWNDAVKLKHNDLIQATSNEHAKQQRAWNQSNHCASWFSSLVLWNEFWLSQNADMLKCKNVTISAKNKISGLKMLLWAFFERYFSPDLLLLIDSNLAFAQSLYGIKLLNLRCSVLSGLEVC